MGLGQSGTSKTIVRNAFDGRELTDIVAAAAGDPTLGERRWALITESPEGGWGIKGHANTGSEIAEAARSELTALSGNANGR